MKVRYNLVSRSEDPARIRLVFRFNKQRLVYYPKIRVPIKFWDDTKMRCKSSYKFPQHTSINQLLDKLEAVTLNAYREALIHDLAPTVALIRRALDRTLNGGESAVDQIPITVFFSTFTDQREKAKAFTENTSKTYRSVARRIKLFEQSTGTVTHFEDVSLEWFYDFIEFLSATGYKMNTIHLSVRRLRTVMEEAFEQGVHQNDIFKSRRFRVSTESTFSIYLTIDELKAIYFLRLDREVLDRARDLFLLGAFTGLRFSDFNYLDKIHFRDVQSQRVIHKVTQKTKEEVMIPVHPVVDAILAKRNGYPPKSMANQPLNRYLKELGEMAEINEDVLVQESAVKKYTMIKTHTARRSFATNAYLSGMPTQTIMKITGHKTESAFMDYIKAGASEHALLISDNNFFKGEGFLQAI